MGSSINSSRIKQSTRMRVRTVSISVALVLMVVLFSLYGWRHFDHSRDLDEMNRLTATQPVAPTVFSTTMVQDLPEPARRYFTYTIAEGTPLYTVADISMEGLFSLGTKQKPNYLNMTARQVLAAPEGFVWKTRAGKGLMQLSGSDSASWTRFWMAGIAPVARLGGDVDHTRSAFGRYVAEAVFWTPAALLLRPGVSWEAVDENTARVTVRHMDLEQAVDVLLTSNGQPTQASFARWSDANPDKVHRLQPFGGYLSQYREFQGFRLPTHVEAGNLFGTDDYFPFFIVDVSSVSFPLPESQP